MKTTTDRVHDEELESLEMKISRFLRNGVIVSGLVMLMGWVGILIERHTAWFENPYRELETYFDLSLAQQVRSAIEGHQWALLISYLGLTILISLPMIRVFLTMVLFFKQKEKVLGWIALFVMVALTASLLLGFEL